MGFLEIINEKKFTLISILLFSYAMLNLLDGERGLISYYKNRPSNPEKLIKNVLSFKGSKLIIRKDHKIFYDFNGSLDENRFDLVKKVIKLIS